MPSDVYVGIFKRYIIWYILVWDMVYEVWNKKLQRETTSEDKIGEHLERNMITEELEEAKKRAFDLAKKRKESLSESAVRNDDDGEIVVRDHTHNLDVETRIEPLEQGEIVYQAECLNEFPSNFNPIYRTVYVVETQL